VIMNSNA